MFRRAIHRSDVLNKRPLTEDANTRTNDSVLENRRAAHNLEKVVFGGGEELIDKFQNTTESKKLGADDKSPILKKKSRLAAWEDVDDQKLAIRNVSNDDKTYSRTKTERLKNVLETKFKEINGCPTWAKLDDKNKKTKKASTAKHSDDDDDDDILCSTDDYFEKNSEFLSKNVIDVKRVCDLNSSSRAEENILNCVEFHPTAAVALVAGQSGIATLFQVDGQTNPKIQSVQFKNFPIKTAHFSSDGEQFIVGSDSFGYFHYYDMIGGKIVTVPWRKGLGQSKMGYFTVSPDNQFIAFQGTYGQIHLLTARTKEWIKTLKMNNNVRAIAFNNDGSKMYSHGDDGEVYVWDINARECVHKFFDDGCIRGTALSVSPDEKYLSCGSDSGVVNVYETSNLSSATPKPSKILLNLTTSINKVKFNYNTEIMGMASAQKDNAIKLVHFPSMTVFSNFPVFNVNVKRPVNFDISLNSGYLSIANNVGRAFLYRLRHYKNY